jgi:galactokinase
VFAAFRAEGYDVPGADIEVESDVPIGAGLSSSAALECALALAIDELVGLGLDRPTLARIARRAENEFVGVPSGILDQSASLLCTAGHALLLDCRDGSTEQVAFDAAAAGLTLLVIDTRAHHELGDGQYAVRKRQCEEACEALEIDSLRDATPDDLERLDGVLQRRARHIVTENDRVHEVAGLLRAGELGALGAVLLASHASMRDDYEISAPELDVAVDAAAEAGAIGARMTGGGFGGSAIALVEDADTVRDAVEAAFARKNYTAPAFLEAVPSAGASRLATNDAG